MHIIETNSLREINKTEISKKSNLYKYKSHQNWFWTNNYFLYGLQKYSASSGNRTRAARVAGEHSTTKPTMLSLRVNLESKNIKYNKFE